MLHSMVGFVSTLFTALFSEQCPLLIAKFKSKRIEDAIVLDSLHGQTAEYPILFTKLQIFWNFLNNGCIWSWRPISTKTLLLKMTKQANVQKKHVYKNHQLAKMAASRVLNFKCLKMGIISHE